MRFENREDPMLWINRAKNGYYDIRGSLCVTGSETKGRSVPGITEVSMVRKGITVRLNRYAYQDGEHLLIPVSRDEAASWNVPLNAVFKDAIANTSLLFPPRIYDLKTGCYIDYPPEALVSPDLYDYERSVPESMAAESGPEDDSGLRLIVSTSPIVGNTPILYPDLLFILGRTIKKDPTILICEPGKLFVFDGEDRRSIEKYIDRYKKRFGITSPDPRIYKYLRKNKQLLDNTSVKEEPDTEFPKESNIPRGSIASAWGDIENRNRLLDWKRRYGKGGDTVS
ncbi:MAG: hypothetical protein K6E66_02455 [Lachnospiraceae bacterium]|nr:hypothetical protein [Lachnospiraceae bacterium]